MIILILYMVCSIIVGVRAVLWFRAAHQKRISTAIDSARQPAFGTEAPALVKYLEKEKSRLRFDWSRVSNEKKKKTETKTKMKTKTKKKAKRANKPASSCHRMITRSRAARFRLLDLPPEVRNRIYLFAVANKEPLSLTKLKFDPELSLNRKLRSEMLPIFFASNTFTSTIRSNWCVARQHFHTAAHVYYERSGKVELSPLLPGSRLGMHGVIRLPDPVVRFHKVHFRIDGCCCADAQEIGSLDLFIENHKLVANIKTNPIHDFNTARSLLKMFLDVKSVVERIESRERFNGVTVEDIKDVASCFRLEKREIRNDRGKGQKGRN